MMYTATFLLKPASNRSLKMSTSVNMSMTTAITFWAWLIILRTTSLMWACPSMGGCM